MSSPFLRSPLQTVGFLLGLATTIWFNLGFLSLAQSVPTPPDQGAPTGRRRGGASRGDCLDYQNLTALVPVVNGIVWSETQSPAPDFFFYIPTPLTKAIPLELVVQDSHDNYVFRQQFSVEAAPGILAVPTHGDGTELVPGETYTWTFSIYCDVTRPSASVSVTGSVKRVMGSEFSTPASAPLSAMPFSMAQQYAATGLWHEALELTLSLRQTDPDNAEYQALLASLLESAGLADIALDGSMYRVPE
jgi:hypothetical protein